MSKRKKQKGKKKKKNPFIIIIYIIVLIALCACIAGLWLRQKEHHRNYQEMVRQAAQMETESQLQHYGSDETEESTKKTETESESNRK